MEFDLQHVILTQVMLSYLRYRFGGAYIYRMSENLLLYFINRTGIGLLYTGEKVKSIPLPKKFPYILQLEKSTAI